MTENLDVLQIAPGTIRGRPCNNENLMVSLLVMFEHGTTITFYLSILVMSGITAHH